jgi:predicted PurR-regulated permease PerM
MQHQQVRNGFFVALFLGALILTFFILKPYLITITIAATVAVIVQPIHRRLLVAFKNREAPAAAATTLATVLLVLIPLTFVAFEVISESAQVYAGLSEDTPSLSLNLLKDVEAAVRRFMPGVSIPPIEQYAGQALRWLASGIGPLFTGTVNTVIHTLLGCIALYYLLKDGRRFMETFATLSPLTDKDDRQITRRLEKAINSIVRGSLLIALLQGVSTSVGLLIFGVPSAILWGSLATVCALIPSLGTSLVLGPAIIYLFVTGQTWPAIGLLIWAVVAVGLIDNLLGPTLVGKGARIHPLIILFSVLGGLAIFGPAGFLLGPLTISLLYALLDIYRQGILTSGTGATAA